MAETSEPEIVKRFDALAAFYGTGRKLTGTGLPTLADAHLLVEALGLENRFDQQFGSKVFKTRSAAELPELSCTLAWALRAGVVRKVRGKLAATATWAKASPAERRRRVLQALVTAGPLALRYPDRARWSIGLDDAIDETFPSLLYRLAEGPLLIAAAAAELSEHLQRRYVLSGYWATEGAVEKQCRRALVTVAGMLELAGAARLEQPGAGAGPAAGEPARAAGAVPAHEEQQLDPAALLVASEEVWSLIDRLDLPARVLEVYRPGVAPSRTVHELRVSLDEIDPPIWRRVVVPSGLSLAALHEALQVVMGWQDYHLHELEIAGKRYGIDDGEDWGEPALDERRHRLDDLAGAGDRFRYWYDFGDDWWHSIEVLDVRPADDEVAPRCVEGERACPPEDCGGPPGFAELLEALADPRHEEHESYRTWAGGDFDPERFELEAVNVALGQLGALAYIVKTDDPLVAARIDEVPDDL